MSVHSSAYQSPLYTNGWARGNCHRSRSSPAVSFVGKMSRNWANKIGYPEPLPTGAPSTFTRSINASNASPISKQERPPIACTCPWTLIPVNNSALQPCNRSQRKICRRWRMKDMQCWCIITNSRSSSQDSIEDNNSIQASIVSWISCIYVNAHAAFGDVWPSCLRYCPTYKC